MRNGESLLGLRPANYYVILTDVQISTSLRLDSTEANSSPPDSTAPIRDVHDDRQTGRSR